MARIAGVDLPRDKRVEIGLTYIYGIGRTSATRILAEAGVNPDTRCRDLTDDEVKKISAVIDETQTDCIFMDLDLYVIWSYFRNLYSFQPESLFRFFLY